jgi:hypothetical protein
MRIGVAFGVVLGMCSQTAGVAQTVGTDVMRKPGNWRGTLLEGTDTVVATNKYGEALFVEAGDTVASMFAPAVIKADGLATEFKKLCIDTGYDEARLAQAAPQSSFALANRRLTIPSPKKGPAYDASVWHSPEARVQIWSGDAAGLNNRQTLSRWRNGATSAPFKHTRTMLPACNVTVMATAFEGPQPFVAAMSRLLGAQPAKSVIKTQWADGHWVVAGPNGGQSQIFYSMVDLDKREQLLHVAITPVEPGNAK